MSALDNEQRASTRRPETWAERAATRAGSSRGNYDERLAARSGGARAGTERQWPKRLHRAG
jgi:hypothetical protein